MLLFDKATRRAMRSASSPFARMSCQRQQGCQEHSCAHSSFPYLELCCRERGMLRVLGIHRHISNFLVSLINDGVAGRSSLQRAVVVWERHLQLPDTTRFNLPTENLGSLRMTRWGMGKDSVASKGGQYSRGNQCIARQSFSAYFLRSRMLSPGQRPE